MRPFGVAELGVRHNNMKHIILLTFLFFGYSLKTEASSPTSLSTFLSVIKQNPDVRLHDGIKTLIDLPTPADISPIIQRATQGYWFNVKGANNFKSRKIKFYGVGEIRHETISEVGYFICKLETDLGPKILVFSNERDSDPQSWWFQFFDATEFAEQGAAANP